jgi:hypothetical protein
MFKRSLLLLLDSCTHIKLYALTHPPSLLANWEDCEPLTWMDKSQVRGRYNCLRDIRRSHCQPFCASVFAQLERAHACTRLIKRKLPCQDFLSLICLFFAPECCQFQKSGGSSRISHSIQEGGPGPSLWRCILLSDCGSPKVWLRMTTFQICE